MEIGIGLPNATRGVQGPDMFTWAREAEQAGFSCLGTIDRLAYENYEALIALAAAAAVTDRIKLVTSVMLAPLRTNTALLAKQAASVDGLSNGRLVLGLAPGGREDDYELSGVDFHTRGKRFDGQLEDLRRYWDGDEIGPKAPGGPTVILGGTVDASFRRAARYGSGWIMGGGPPDAFKEALPKLEAAWRDAGREGEPRKMALSYFSLDDDPEGQARATIGHYYGFLGEWADQIVESVAKGDDAVRERVRSFEEAGADELILFPASSNPEQVDRLAAATNP
jgi:alkanesulfonate monooxygenase SsuD/methylene tetrahydromethanopterin reductase-like flavin-dependent oxidoreductase (luciferase family)